MRISIIQPNVMWEDKSGNLRQIDHLISPLKNKTDIIILPEMFNTGFSMDTEKLCEKPFSSTFDWMVRSSSEGNFSLCGSYIIREKNRFYNRWVFITPAGRSWSYDKRHLFTISGEEKAFTPGRKRVSFKSGDVRICPNICYDLRFPVWSRNRNNYDLLINSASWPEARRDVWITLLRARAIENQCFVAGSNRVGIDGKGIKYSGDSMIINPRGEIIISAKKYEECSISAEISMKELKDFRRKFPVLKDADNFTLEL